MLLNNLDPEVAEQPEDIVVYGGCGQGGAQPRGAARDRPASSAISLGRRDPARPIRQGGRPLPARTPTRLACSSQTRTSWGRWATFSEFRRLEALGLTMYGQMTAGSWIYIGSQGIIQGTFETFAAPRGRRTRRGQGGPAAAGC